MTSISHTQRYIPHELNTKFYVDKLYRNGYSISFVCRRYIISKYSLMRWNRKFNGTEESLIDKSHRPFSKTLVRPSPTVLSVSQKFILIK